MKLVPSANRVRSLVGLLAMLVAVMPSGCSQLPLQRGANDSFPVAAGAKATRSAKAIKSAKASPELPPAETARVCLATAEELERNGHLREAILLYEKARLNDSQVIDYARRLAVLYDRSGEADRARVEYEKALAKRPDDPDLLNDVGYFHYRQGRYAEAERAFRDALRGSPDHTRATVNLGLALAEQRDVAGSFEVFSRVLGEAAAHYNVGALLARQGRIPEAQEALRRALAIDPTLDRSRALLAYLESRGGTPGGEPSGERRVQGLRADPRRSVARTSFQP